MSARDDEIRRVVAELDAHIAAVEANVAVLKALLAFAGIDVVATVLIARGAATKAYVQPAAAHQIQHGRILGNADGVVEWRHHHGGADAYLCGTCGKVGRQDQRGGYHAVACKVVFGQPGALKS